MKESKRKLENAICYCFKIYESNEKTKKDTWCDMIGCELFDLWEKKVEQVKDEKQNEKKKDQIQNLADLVNYTLMLLVRAADPKLEYYATIKRHGFSDVGIVEEIIRKQRKNPDLTEEETLKLIYKEVI